MWREKTDKRIVAAGIVLVGLFIGYGTWKDLHPPPRSAAKVVNLTPYYLSESNEELAALPQDNNPAIVWVGDIEAADDGETVFTASPVRPVSIPQREITLFYRVKTPFTRNLSSVYKTFEQTMTPWTKTGNLINNIYIEYLPEQPDLQSLAALCNGLRGYFRQEYWIDLQIRRASEELTPEQKRDFGNLLKSVRILVYDTKEVRQSEEERLTDTIVRLSREGIPFALRLPRQPDISELAKGIGDNAENLGGFVIESVSGPEPGNKEKKP